MPILFTLHRKLWLICEYFYEIWPTYFPNVNPSALCCCCVANVFMRLLRHISNYFVYTCFWVIFKQQRVYVWMLKYYIKIFKCSPEITWITECTESLRKRHRKRKQMAKKRYYLAAFNVVFDHRTYASNVAIKLKHLNFVVMLTQNSQNI